MEWKKTGRESSAIQLSWSETTNLNKASLSLKMYVDVT